MLCASAFSVATATALAEGPGSKYGGAYTARFSYSAPAEISRGSARLGETDAVEFGLR